MTGNPNNETMRKFLSMGDEFESHYEGEIKEYARRRVFGQSWLLAMHAAFNIDRNDKIVEEWRLKIESTATYTQTFEHVLSNTDISELWDGFAAVKTLMEIIHSDDCPGRTKVDAIRELNILTGLVEPGPLSKRKARPTTKA
ncbi:hypothetical protein [Pantoea sp. A4]|uniref:hypothetical protein n=1 Tax=Pantoea sp. A4 TaxID=1225184 RepID=UPI00036135F4|nr:hypothetical protein [Pantoea sp. A4]